MLQRWMQSWRQSTITNKFIAIASGIVAAATVVYAIVAYWQWQALLDSNKTNREALISVQRAFLTFNGFQPAVRVEHNGKTVFVITGMWENSGNTPTPIAAGYANYNILTDQEFEKFDFREAEGTAFSHTVIGPKQPALTGPLLVPEDDLNAVKLSAKHLIVWGWQVYKDVFWPETKPRLTEYCYDLKSLIVTENGKSTTLNLAACSRHNCADEQCEDYDRLTSKLPQ